MTVTSMDDDDLAPPWRWEYGRVVIRWPQIIKPRELHIGDTVVMWRRRGPRGMTKLNRLTEESEARLDRGRKPPVDPPSPPPSWRRLEPQGATVRRGLRPRRGRMLSVIG